MAFRTAPSQRVGQLKPAPGMRWPRIGLLPPFVHHVRIHECPAQCRVGYAPMHRRGGWVILLPRGPRSSPGYAVPVYHHLIDPIRPTRRHITTSPQGGLYAMPSLCGSAQATREWFRAFADHLTCDGARVASSAAWARTGTGLSLARIALSVLIAQASQKG